MENNQHFVTIGIPAYNEDANICLLLQDILSQKLDNFSIIQIIISSDGSEDNTVRLARSISDERILIIDNKERLGVARGVNQVIKDAKGDILILLDGDIRIFDKDFVSKLVMPIIKNKADLVSSAILGLQSRSQLSKILSLSMKLKSILFRTFRRGDNIYNCYGLARGFSEKFYKKLHFPASIGNDMYSYLACIDRGFLFHYAANAVAYYRLPENLDDHRKQSLRFFVAVGEQEKTFNPEFVRAQTKIPINDYIKSAFLAIPLLIKNPLTTLAYFLILSYLRLSRKNERVWSQTWDIAISSKGN